MKKRLSYVPALDGLRAVAVLIVMLAHSAVKGFVGGGQGVEIFFVLSGFLITTLLLEEIGDTGRVDIKNFYIRRLLRLYPALLLFLLIYCLCAHFTHVPFVKDAALTGFYLMDYAMAFNWHTPNALTNHTWSLAVEEQFYLLWAPLIPFLRRWFRGKSLAGVLAAGFVAATLWKLAPLALGVKWEFIYFRFDTRLAGLLLGGCLAVCRIEKIKIPHAGWGAYIFGAILAFCIMWMPSMAASLYQSVPAELFTFFLIYQLMENPDWKPVRWLSQEIPVFFGRISYALYLFHFPIAMFGREKIQIPAVPEHLWPVLVFGFTLAVSTGISYYSFRTVEKAGRTMAKRYRRRQTVPDALTLADKG